MKESRCFRWRGVAAFTFMLAMTAANALTPLALPDVPIGSAGAVVAIARQSDGGLILGGYFTRIDGVPRRNLARIATSLSTALGGKIDRKNGRN